MMMMSDCIWELLLCKQQFFFICLYCEAWSCRRSVSVSSCRCCMFVYILRSKVRTFPLGGLPWVSAVLFILRCRLLVYFAGSGENRMQVVLSGFSVRLLCFVQEKTLCMYACIHPGHLLH